ncbi:hypothetical protein [Rhizobium leguminosarum]
MRTTSLVKRRISFAVVAIWVLASPAHGYDFTLGDLRTELQIVQDFATGTLDDAAISDQARQGILHPWGPLNSSDILRGPLIEVCPTLSVVNEYGHQYQFRSKHEGGNADWMVTTPVNEESTITGILIAVLPSGADQIGAPIMLPMMLPGATMVPPGNLCLSPVKIGLLEQRQEAACKEWPELCDNP